MKPTSHHAAFRGPPAHLEHVVLEREAQFELAGADGAGVGAVVDVRVPVAEGVHLQTLLVRGEPVARSGIVLFIYISG